jgi:hypothetical protein
VKSQRMRMICALTVVALVMLMMIIGFRRAYVMPAASLLTRATNAGDKVMVSGSLIHSGGYITKTTTSRYGSRLLVRVYAADLPSDADMRKLRGTFSVVVEPREDIQSIAIGERPHWLTIGTIFGIAVRIPTFDHEADSEEVIWQR